MELDYSESTPEFFKRVFIILRIDFKNTFLKKCFISIISIFLTPVLFGISNLDKEASAIPLEMFVSLMGILILANLFDSEQDKEIYELISSKPFELYFIYIIRVIYSIIYLIIVFGLFLYYMKFRNCDISLVHFTGTLSNVLFLGGLGMFSSAITNNFIFSYMIPLMYYLLNFSGNKFLKSFFLFSMSNGDFKFKLPILISGILLIILAIVIKKNNK
ncbi:hypothetical protein OF820_06140 [Oceanotoga sp. DSM 15011]|uniref:hypothetical protein n=1 Tax=Oceanotoga sp. DSM 15011 TaxID=2984951 RepID=UPI0021F41F5B|nr:hypothetical protein [Oceanotoga sp. DSM 15011]UYP01265.1 hypothetical protein OF820_06140 [Oceanotoga sp. DSM 15011]